MEVRGIKEVSRALQRLGTRTQSRVVRAAVSAALTPIVKAAKRLAPKDQGNLKASIGKAVKTYKASGVIYGVVGPRRKFKRTRKGVSVEFAGISRLTHLVEFGTAPHVIEASGGSLVIDGEFAGPIVVHPGAKASPFLRPAFVQTKTQALAIFKRKAWERMKIEIAKERRKQRRR